MKKIFVTGIDTNVGKSVVSSILVKALGADYWKPIQSGDLEHSDSRKVKELVDESSVVFSERYQLNQPLSPHVSAKLDNVEINLSDFILPKTSNNLIIEGAGGLMVPINEKGDYIADLIKQFDAEVVLVIKNYLGSINHTLLSINYLLQHGIKILGIFVIGDANQESENIISLNTKVPILHHVPWVNILTPEFILDQSRILKEKQLFF